MDRIRTASGRKRKLLDNVASESIASETVHRVLRLDTRQSLGPMKVESGKWKVERRRAYNKKLPLHVKHPRTYSVGAKGLGFRARQIEPSYSIHVTFILCKA